MTHPITADHLVDIASKAVTEELFREFNRTLHSFLDIAMKRRKSESRRYFLDKMREKINLRMQRDGEKELKRCRLAK